MLLEEDLVVIIQLTRRICRGDSILPAILLNNKLCREICV